MLRRITADWDFKNPFLIAFYLIRVWSLSPKEIIIKKSNSKGYHCIVWIDGDLNKEEILLLRKFIGDDKQRRRIDEKRDKPRQYLFYKKEVKKKQNIQ